MTFVTQNFGPEERGDKGSPDGRKCLRADSLIVATARSQGVSVFFSHDKHCRTMATRARMEAFDLPTTADTLCCQEVEMSPSKPK